MTRPKLAISQRLDYAIGRPELREALDIKLASFFWEIGFLPIPLCCSVTERETYLKELSPDAIVLSGGNNIDEFIERDQLEIDVINFSIQNKVPLLGICRGMQMINHYFGGRLRHVQNHTSTSHEITGEIVSNHVKSVNSFHDFGMLREDLGKNIVALASSRDGVVEAIRHQVHPLLGIMWHPERNSLSDPMDATLIRSHFGDLK